MDDKWLQALVATGTALVGLALVAVLVGQNSQTSSVISSVSQGFAQVLTAAIAPVTGGSSSSSGTNV